MPGPDAGGGAAGASLTQEFGLKLVEMAHRWRRVLDERLRPTGLSQAQWRTLLNAGRMDGILQKDLAIALGIEGPSLVRLLDRLEGDGLIERRAAVPDRRGKTLHLTPKGKARERELARIVDEVRAQLLDGTSAAELVTCMQVFERIRANAERRIGDAE
jgi:MarR family transcriptional regulator, transcriptional regulator for hemolysin